MLLAIFCVASCVHKVPVTLTKEEMGLINGSPEIMRVLSVHNPEDSLFLKQSSRNLNIPDLLTPELESLRNKMLATLASEAGVGIAAPQVGIHRRLIAVQRFDKEGKPIEVYVNPWIVETRGEKQTGPEGCLSVPGYRGDVPRYQDITIRYTSLQGSMLDQPNEISEDIKGYTAVIFQHEIDHLDGVIYTDRAESVYKRTEEGQK